MIWSHGKYAVDTLDLTSDAGMSYHGPSGHSTTWQLTINSDGSVVTAGDNGNPSATPITTTEVISMSNGSTLSIGYDSVA